MRTAARAALVVAALAAGAAAWLALATARDRAAGKAPDAGSTTASRLPDPPRSPGLAPSPERAAAEVVEAAPEERRGKPRPGLAQGVFSNHDGTPARTFVSLYEERRHSDGRLWPVYVAGDATDEKGRFAISGTAGASAWVHVQWGPSTSCFVSRVPKDGSPMRLAWPEERTVVVRVIGADGRPAWRVPVELTRAVPEEATAHPKDGDFSAWFCSEPLATHRDTDREGVAHFTAGAGPLVAVARPLMEHEAPPPAPVRFEGNEVEIRLEEGRTVWGEVRDPDGEALAGAYVWWRVADGPWLSKRLGEGGAYSLRALPAGTVELWAEVFGREPGATAKTTVIRTDAGETDLTAFVGHELLVRLEGWPAGAAGDAELVDRSETFARFSVQRTRVSGTGEARFRRLAPGRTYALRAATEDGSHVAYDLNATKDGETLRLRAVPAARATLALEADVPFSVVRVGLADFELDWEEAGDEGAHEVRVAGLPEGRHALEVLARTGTADRLRATVDVDVPGRTRVKLADPEGPAK